MRKFALLAALVAAHLSVFGQNLYIQYDANCMDKMEYKFVEQKSGVSYSAYRLNKSNNEKIFFETGVEGVNVRPSVPGKLTRCSDVRLDKNDVVDINRGKKRVYICKKLDSGWAILPVGTASYMNFADNFLTYQGSDYDMQADFKQSLSGNDLAQIGESSKSNIYYAGQMPACNQEAYRFKKVPRETCKDDAELAILPSVGLLQDFASSGQKFELVSINGMPVCDYLTKGNAPVRIAPEPQPEATPEDYSVVVRPAIEPPMVIVTEKSVPETPKVECNIIANEGEHVVSQGENLYVIARRYGLTVNNLRAWNDMTTDAIYPCSVVKVIAPPAPEQPSMAIARVNDVPMSYNTVVKPKPKKIECNVDANEGEHVVQQGESLYAVARQYSLKVDNLRAWNRLMSDRIQPCSKLIVVAPKVEVKGIPAPKIVKAKTIVAPKVVAVKKPQPKKAVVVAVKKTEPVMYVKKGSGFYVVKKGETVAGIAKRYNMDESGFRQCNNLSATEKVNIGQILTTQCACNLDDAKPTPVKIEATAVVMPRPKVRTMALEQDVPESYNTIVRPKAVKVKDKTEGVTPKGLENRTRKYHVVLADETILSIAKKYNTTVEKLRSLNRLEEKELIIPNQLLVLE